MHARVILLSLAIALALPLSGPALAEQEQEQEQEQPQKPGHNDPLRPINKVIFRFNATVDRHLLRPVARGYVRFVPGWARRPVGRFFNNLAEPVTVVGSLMQGKPGAALHHSARFVVNSTLGLGGLADPASHLRLPPLNQEDLGQTLAVWGVPSGPYLVLPLLGPSTLRDGLAILGDSQLPGLTDLHPVRHRNALYTLSVVDARGELLRLEQVFDTDYDRIRDLYLQRREYLARDGAIQEDDFGADWD